ncbi:MAG: amidophosphoribosyltransferase [Patescibacteria group bacterium]|nr:amidophosphoribosyltransferase [Patescibacteria group bacterium]
METSKKESCGLFGAFGKPETEDMATTIYTGLFSIQHRGQEGAGIVVSDGTKFRRCKDIGLVSNVFPEKKLNELIGHFGIGHVRYSTTGSNCIKNVQPLILEHDNEIWAIAHNGNLINAHALRQSYQKAGSIFQTTTDSEVLFPLLTNPKFKHQLCQERVINALNKLKGAFSFLIMTKNCVMAARDPNGFKPLAIGKKDNVWFFASETCAFIQIGADYIRDVEPGEIVIADNTGLHSIPAKTPSSRISQCIFEYIYFARPDSKIFTKNVHSVRLIHGKLLAKEHPVEADIVMPVPSSGDSAALGYSRESNIPLDYGFIRNHYIGRTFIMPETNTRETSVDMKILANPEVIKGKRIIVVDDSIVRGNTSRHRVSHLRRLGAKEVHMRIACSPITHPCFYGIDFPTKNELIAGIHDINTIRKLIEVDSLGYLSLNGMLSPFDDPENFCTACFNGDYPVPVDSTEINGKYTLESNQLIEI